jgi:membrane-associated phospholipid phosphatase
LHRRLLRCLPGAIYGLLLAHQAVAAGGPLGIDHRLRYDDSGIWSRHTQLAMLDLLILGDVTGAVWEGGQTRLGRTFWQSIDALVLGGVSSTALKITFSRERPGQTPDPNRFFTGHGNQSFPSGEVTATSAIVTPFVLEYGRDHPLVWALEALPLYDAEARMKTWGHWQTDVLAGFALGTAVGYYAHLRNTSFSLSVMPHAVAVGLSTRW